MCIKNAASVVIQKKKIKERNKVHILGYDKVIKEAIKQRRKACSIWKKERNNIQKQQKHQEYLERKQEVNRLIEEAETAEINGMITKQCQDQPNFWKMIKKIKRKKGTEERFKNNMGEMTKETNEILQIKRQYYKELYAKPTQSKEERTQEKKYEQELNKGLHNEKANMEKEINKKFTEKKIEVAIDKAKNNKAPGPDGITNEMIKEGKEELKGLLLELFNEMLQNNEKIPETVETGRYYFHIQRKRGTH